MNKKILTAAALTLMLVGGAISLVGCNHKNVNVGTNGTTASSTDATTETKVTINTKDVDKDYWKNLVGDDHNVTITSKDKNTGSKSDKTSDKAAKSDKTDKTDKAAKSGKTDKATAGKTDKKPSENVSKEPKANTDKPAKETTKAPAPQPTEEPSTEKIGCSHNWVTEQKVVKDAWDETIVDEPEKTQKVKVKDAWDETKKVKVKDAWDEQVYVGDRSIQNETGEDMTNVNTKEWCKKHNCRNHFLGNGPCATDVTSTPIYKTVHHDAEYTTKTIHHDAEYTTKTIPAKTHTVHHDAEYKSVTYCSKCGKTK